MARKKIKNNCRIAAVLVLVLVLVAAVGAANRPDGW
jgi:hypothetical protein